MQLYEIEAWLGDFAAELTDEQISQLSEAAEAIAARYPDPDDEDQRRAALIVAHRLLVEDQDAVVTELARQLAEARRAEIEALAGLRQAACTLVQDVPRGQNTPPELTTEAGFARRAGVTRSAVIAWRRDG